MSRTIVAIATPLANGPIGIIRISGPSAIILLERHFRASKPTAKFAQRELVSGYFVDGAGQNVDHILAVIFRAPHSFTGEDVVELHGHGNLLLLNKIIHCLLDHPDLEIDLARPGEFSLRAFQHGKMDLTQAEAIHGIIHAESEASLKASLANLGGQLSKLVQGVRDKLILTQALVEASFEFPEEDIETYDIQAFTHYLQELIASLRELLSAYKTSQIADRGISVALVGRPNVGKSSLLNALLQEERAIVTPIAGTTRDVVEGTLLHSGFKFIFRDTAGVRDSADPVESIGVERSYAWMKKSDIVFLITDDPSENFSELKELLHERNNIYTILNKIDLHSAEASPEHFFSAAISVKERINLDSVFDLLDKYLKSENCVQISVHVNQRQFHLLERVFLLLNSIAEHLVSRQISEEILAEELRECARFLQDITGEISSDDVLGEIFSRFCIGK